MAWDYQQGVNVCKSGDESDWDEWLRRVTCGDASAEAELYHRYKDGVAIIIGQIVHNESATEDLSQETFRISLKKIRDGAVREPERLSGFVRGVARNLAIDYIRKMRRSLNHEEPIDAEHIPARQPDPYDHLLRKERAGIVRQMISEMKIARDREVLSRYFIAEESKEQICADLGLTSQHFNSIVHRALNRYKELYIKRFGDPLSDDAQKIFDL